MTGEKAACLLHSRLQNYRCLAFLATVISCSLSIAQRSNMCAVIYCRSEVLNTFIGQILSKLSSNFARGKVFSK